MALSVLDDKTKVPTAGILRSVLGRSAVHWASLTEYLASTYAPLAERWNFAGANYGWSLRCVWKERALVYLTPCKGYFLASFALGRKAVEAAHNCGLPAKVLKTIDEAPQYAEGRGVRLEVRSKPDVESVKRLVTVKVEH